MNKEAMTLAVTLEEAVEDALHGEATLAGAPLSVAVEGTTVTLSGSVSSAHVKELATEIAGYVPGVLEVINALVVAPHAGGEGAGSAAVGWAVNYRQPAR